MSHVFPQINENKAAKHGSAFGPIKLSAFQTHLKPSNKVALSLVLIQASLDRIFLIHSKTQINISLETKSGNSLDRQFSLLMHVYRCLFRHKGLVKKGGYMRLPHFQTHPHMGMGQNPGT